LPELVARAAAGDAYAACRLGSDLARCQHYQRFMLEIGGLEEHLRTSNVSSAEQGKMKARLALLRRFSDPSTGLCEGLQEEQLTRAWEYALMAANAGHLSSMMRFAGFQTGIGEGAQYAEGVIAWRENSPRFLEYGVAKGDVRAYDLASRFHFRKNSGVWVLPQDPVMALAYRYALRDHPNTWAQQNEGLINTITGELTPQEVTEAREHAVELRRRLNMSPPDGDVRPDGKMDIMRDGDSAYCAPP
jgi:hypothetical protein